jgi:hypothetical protein
MLRKTMFETNGDTITDFSSDLGQTIIRYQNAIDRKNE